MSYDDLMNNVKIALCLPLLVLLFSHGAIMSKTKKPLSSISYNTYEFLKATLDRLIESGDLDFYCFINHRGELNEDGTREKQHFHVFMWPATALDPRQLRNEFIEFVKDEKFPRGFMPVIPSDWQNWYLYDLHDSDYLASKGQSREFHYTDNDMKRSNDDFYWDLVHHIDRTKINPLGAVIRAAQSGMSFAEYVTLNHLSLLQVRSAQFVFDEIQKGFVLCRAGRQDHEPVDVDTGEYISPVDIE